MARLLLVMVLLAAFPSGASAARINKRISKASKEKVQHLQADGSQKVDGSTETRDFQPVAVVLVNKDGQRISMATGQEMEKFWKLDTETVGDLKASLKYRLKFLAYKVTTATYIKEDPEGLLRPGLAEQITNKNWRMDRLYGIARTPAHGNEKGEYILDDGENLKAACQKIQTDPSIFTSRFEALPPCLIFWDIETGAAEALRARELEEARANRAKEAKKVATIWWDVAVVLVNQRGEPIGKDYAYYGDGTETVAKLKETLRSFYAKDIAKKKWHMAHLYGVANYGEGEYILEDSDTLDNACRNVQTDINDVNSPFNSANTLIFDQPENPCHIFWDVESTTA